MALMVAPQIHLHPTGTVSASLPAQLERGDTFLTREHSNPRRWKTIPRTRAASWDQLSQVCENLSRPLRPTPPTHCVLQPRYQEPGLCSGTSAYLTWSPSVWEIGFSSQPVY